jgi:hypothetical protein
MATTRDLSGLSISAVSCSGRNDVFGNFLMYLRGGEVAAVTRFHAKTVGTKTASSRVRYLSAPATALTMMARLR